MKELPRTTTKENDNGNCRISYSGDMSDRKDGSRLPTFQMQLIDNRSGASFWVSQLSHFYLEMLWQTLGEFLGKRSVSTQIVEIRLVHDVLPQNAPVGTMTMVSAKDLEREEIDAIKERMTKG